MRISTVLLIACFILVFAASCAVPLDQINGARRTGVVVLNVEPSDAKVFLDGTYIGTAEKFDGNRGVLRVSLGGHVISLTADDFENELREVIAREQPQTITVKMLPKPKPSSLE